MDPATIGATVVTILAPYVADAGKEIVKAAGEAGLQKAKGLLSWLKERFADDPVAASDLSRFEKNPEAFAPGLEATIAEKAKADPQFSEEIATRVQELAPVLTVIQEFREATDLTGVKGGAVRTGSISVTQKGDVARNVKGVDVQGIG